MFSNNVSFSIKEFFENTDISKCLKRFYTDTDFSIDNATNWVKRSVKITNNDGSIVYENNDVEVPEHFSQLATDILASKYFYRGEIPGSKNGETSFKQVIHRITHTIAQAGLECKILSNKNVQIFTNELSYMLINQIGAFNSPVWFNCGLYHVYGVKGTGITYAFDGTAIKEIHHPYSKPQCSACFIQSVDDDLMSIFELVKREAKLFKFGSGSGSNFSNLRAKNEKLSGGGTSSGLMSFLEVLDRAAGATKSGGTTRRAAKMVCLDLDHPEIVDFIQWKTKEEDKVRALISMGYPSDFNGEAYRTVSGQNSNNSVRISNDFFKALDNNSDWELKARTTGETLNKISAKKLWNTIASSAWHCADPGVQYDTTINEWHTCKTSGRINASNPCSEYMFLDDTACNLASLNLTKFYDDNKNFDYEAYMYAIMIFIIAQEILVDLSSYPTPKIAKNSYLFRPLGLGYANLGTLLMLEGLSYDSDESRNICSQLTSILTGTSYYISSLLANKIGAFSSYEINKYDMLKVINKHLSYAIDPITNHVWNAALINGTNFGYRNSQVTVLAPTGTIGLLMDCDTTGIEPDYSLVKYKKLAGGGHFKIINQSVPFALKRLNYDDEQIKAIVNYVIENGTIEGAPHLNDKHLSVFDCANKCGKGTRFLSPESHLRMMAAAQPSLSGAISKTVNMPNDVTVEDIERIYYLGWKLGLKAVAIYRDGSKACQPLSSTMKSITGESNNALLSEIEKLKQENLNLKKQIEQQNSKIEQIKCVSKQRILPKKRKGFTQEAKVNGHKIFLRTGEFEDGTLGEIFVDIHKEGAAFRSVMNCLAMSVSLGLQYGVPLETFVEQFVFTRFEPQGMVEDHPNIKMATSIVDYIFRVLGFEYLDRYDLCHVKPQLLTNAMSSYNENKIAHEIYDHSNENDDNVIASEVVDDNLNKHLENMMGDAPICDSCGHITVRNGSCYRCLNCGSSMGCS